jgi:hypothetical protein
VAPGRRSGRLVWPTCRTTAAIPTIWLTVEHEQLSAPAFDPADPPLFEAEASYLERHGLFLPGERRRLRKADWAPEAAEL